MSRLTADEAEKISRSKDPAYAVESILDGVRKAAELGQRMHRTRDFGFGDAGVHTSEKDWPALNQDIVKDLRSLGFKADVQVEYRQFADIWLEVSWGSKS